MIADYHTHPQAHRLQPYSLDLLRPWAERCVKLGIKEIAFTDHDRYCQAVNLDVVEQLREVYPAVCFLKGIELDNDPVSSEAGKHWVEKNWSQLDFVLASVHYLPGEERMFDASGEEGQFEKHGIAQAYELYVKELEKMLQYGAVDCFSHLDLIKIYGHRIDDSETLQLFVPLLEKIAKAGKSIEINTAGWRKPVAEQYPAVPLLREAVRLGVTITISSDAHSYAQVAEGYDRLGEVLQAAGIREIALYEKHEKRLTPLEKLIA
jgi:histidinol-phosphatase (PHP family)